MVVVVPALLRSVCISPCLLAFNPSSPQSKKAIFRGVRVDSLGGQDSAVLSTDSVGVNGFPSVVDKKKEEDRRRIGSLTDLGFVKKQKVSSSSSSSDDELEVLWDDGYGKNTVKDYLNISKEMIKPDGGPPCWFCPVECGRPLQGSPVLLFLPGMDGIGMGLVLHHKALGRAFEVRCLHIPVYDRTPFEGLVKFVEEAVRTEYALSPKKPIYLVGDSFGGGLALSVAARNPSIDLVLVLANPATSFDRSPLQPILPLLEALPDGLHSTIPYLLSLIMGDPVKMASVNIENRLSPPAVLEQLSANLTALLPLLSGLSDIIPKETLPWKLKLLKSACSYTNSRLHAVTAEVLVLASFSGKDNMLPSEDEAKRLSRSLRNCKIRVFKDNGHTILLEDGVNLLKVIKGTLKYHRSRSHDFVRDFLPPSASDFEEALIDNLLYRRIISPVMLSTLEDGTIVRGLSGVPEEGPVLLVGYHMLMGLELVPLVVEFLREKNVMVRGLAHPALFIDRVQSASDEFSFIDSLKVFGATPVTANNLYKLLSTKSHVLLYPGGAREALHQKGETYKLFWPQQAEFVRMAAKFGATIVPFGVVGEDDVLEASEMWPCYAMTSNYKPQIPHQAQLLRNMDPATRLSLNHFLLLKDSKKSGSCAVVRNAGSNLTRKDDVPEKLEPLWDDGCGTKSFKDYLDGARDMVRPDGGPPRWFCPVECGCPLKESPLLLFLPGIDDLGLGLIMHHKALGKVFEVRCLHIPVRDQTPFKGLVKLVEETIKLERASSPKKPIYLVGDSFGGCLALSVAARNPKIDLVLILANPATFIRSQNLLSLFGSSPDELYASVLRLCSLTSGYLKMEIANPSVRINPIQKLGQLFHHLTSVFSCLPVLGDIVPMEVLLWKLNLLKSAASYANSRLQAIEAEVLVLFSGKNGGNVVRSKDEALRLSNSIQNCVVRRFEDRGPCLLLEDGFNLLSVIKGTCKYRRSSRRRDFVTDYLPPSSSETDFFFDKIFGYLRVATSPVMLSTMEEDGKIVKGLGGIPDVGPMILIGNHMMLGLELSSLIEAFLREKRVMIRGLTHPEHFSPTSPDDRLNILYDHMKVFGALPVSARNLSKLLSTNSYVLLYPGGTREGLHCKGEEYKLFWPDEPEFVRMAARYGATIVPFGVVGEDDFGHLLFDYNEMMNIPSLGDRIKKIITDTGRLSEVTNEGFVLPVFVPKFPPGRFYYMFGRPIKTKGKEKMLEDKEYAKEFYVGVKSQVEGLIAYLINKREEDPYRNYMNRAIYMATLDPTHHVPTFDP